MDTRMSEKEAYSWLMQPGIQARLFDRDRHTNAALKVAINSLGERVGYNKKIAPVGAER